MTAIFRAEHIVKRYAAHTALNDVSISINQGSVFGLLGPNGAGKSSLIRIINQITGPDAGHLFFKDEPLAPKHIEKIGYLPEERGLYKKMKVGEQAIYLAQLKGLSHHDAKKKLNEWFERFELGSWWNKKVEELSKGMQQKVQFIVTVLHEPELLIFDEPFTGFDPINANLIKDEILRLKQQGATIVFSTHRMESVEELCDHIALINKSQKILDGAVMDIKEQFRTYVYELQFKGSLQQVLSKIPSNISVVNTTETPYFNTIRIQLAPGESANTFLQAVMQEVEIRYFKEVIPTMNDIFIQKVKEVNPGILV